MKSIYVCYESYGYDGLSEPIVAFKDEEMAKKWAAKAKDSYRCYKNIEVV